MGYLLYKYSGNTPSVLNGKVNIFDRENNKLEIQVFKPSLFNPFLQGYCKSFKDYIIYLYWLIISYFELAIYYVKNGEKIIHTSLVTGKSFKFPFMKKNDWHIGPCVTVEGYRGRGIYPKVLQKITYDFYKRNNSSQSSLYMIVKDTNIPSIKGVHKAGFVKIADIVKNRWFCSYRYSLMLHDWKYYNHAVIPNTAPHITPDLTPIKDGTIWNIDGKFPLFVRYTTDFNYKEDTSWYFVVKDSEYEIESLKSNRRKKITKGRKYFYIQTISARDYKSDMASICEEAFASYPDEYRPNFSSSDYIGSIENGEWDKYAIVGVFYRLTNELAGYVTLLEHDRYIEAQQHKVKPSFEKYYVNYALVDGMLSYFNKKIIDQKKYIVNGNTNLVHNTAFYDLLIDHFGYRKAYCKLNIVYRPVIRPFVTILYLFRRTISHFKNIHPLIYKINAVLEMENIARKCRAMQ